MPPDTKYDGDVYFAEKIAGEPAILQVTGRIIFRKLPEFLNTVKGKRRTCLFPPTHRARTVKGDYKAVGKKLFKLKI